MVKRVLEYISALFLDLENKNIYLEQLWTGSAGIVWNKVLAMHVEDLEVK